MQLTKETMRNKKTYKVQKNVVENVMIKMIVVEYGVVFLYRSDNIQVGEGG